MSADPEPTPRVPADMVFCFHPDAVTERQQTPGRWTRRRSGECWRLVWRPAGGVYVRRCPACPAVAYQLDVGMAVELTLGPGLISKPEPSWWWVDHYDSDRSYHLYCPGCRAQIPAFLIRYESQTESSDEQCEGCGVGG